MPCAYILHQVASLYAVSVLKKLSMRATDVFAHLTKKQLTSGIVHAGNV